MAWTGVATDWSAPVNGTVEWNTGAARLFEQPFQLSVELRPQVCKAVLGIPGQCGLQREQAVKSSRDAASNGPVAGLFVETTTTGSWVRHPESGLPCTSNCVAA